MADLKAPLPTVAFFLLGLLPYKIGGSAQGSIFTVKTDATENVNTPYEKSTSIVHSWSQSLRHLPKDKQLLNPKQWRKNREQDKITFDSKTRLSQLGNIHVHPKNIQAGRKFKPVSFLPATKDLQDEDKKVTLKAGSLRKYDAKPINPLSTNSSSDLSNVTKTQHHSAKQHDMTPECTHNLHNESTSELQASPDLDYIHVISSEGIGRRTHARKNSREPYQTNHHPGHGIPSEVGSNNHARLGRSIREEANAKNIDVQIMKKEVVNSYIRRQDERSRQAFNVQQFLPQRKPNEIIEIELPSAYKSRAGVSSLGRVANAEKNAPRKGNKNRPNHKNQVNLVTSNHTFQNLVSSSSPHLHPSNSFHVTNESKGHRSKTAGHTKEENLSSSPGRSDFFSLPHVMRRRRRRRWGQRPRRPTGGNLPFGRSRTRDRNTPSRSPGRASAPSPYRPRASPDAQVSH